MENVLVAVCQNGKGVGVRRWGVKLTPAFVTLGFDSGLSRLDGTGLFSLHPGGGPGHASGSLRPGALPASCPKSWIPANSFSRLSWLVTSCPSSSKGLEFHVLILAPPFPSDGKALPAPFLLFGFIHSFTLNSGITSSKKASWTDSS